MKLDVTLLRGHVFFFADLYSKNYIILTYIIYINIYIIMNIWGILCEKRFTILSCNYINLFTLL